MVFKLFAFSRRRGGVSVDEFRAHWVGVHARQIADEPTLRRHVRRYELRSRLDADETAGLGDQWDGVASLEFDSLAAFQAMQAEPAFGAHADDGREFREDDQLVAATTGPHRLVAPTGSETMGVEVVHVVARAPGAGHAEFVSRWLEHGRSTFAGSAPPGLLRAEQWQATEVSGDTVGGVAQLRFASLEAFRHWHDGAWCDAGADTVDAAGSLLFVSHPPTVIDLGVEPDAR